MSKLTYTFYEGGGNVIPGIPRDQGGEGHAGLQIDVDTDTMTVIDRRLANAPNAINEHELPTVEESQATEPLAPSTEEIPPFAEEKPGDQTVSQEAEPTQKLEQAITPADIQEVQ